MYERVEIGGLRVKIELVKFRILNSILSEVINVLLKISNYLQLNMLYILLILNGN